MNQTKLIQRAHALSNDAQSQVPGPSGAAEIRTLTDLELTIAAGGDGVVIWTPPTP